MKHSKFLGKTIRGSHHFRNMVKSQQPLSQLQQILCYSTHTNCSSKTTLSSIDKKYKSGIPITMLTAYDFSTTQLINSITAPAIDILLVGDSVGMTHAGHTSTIPVTMDDMVYHSRAVNRANPSSFVIGDLPFGSYEVCSATAAHNSIKLIKDGGCNGIKLEGGKQMAKTVSAIVSAGIPVMGHIGLTPQSINMLSGYTVQGKSCDAALRLVEDALELERAGAMAIVLECVPEALAKEITDLVNIPTIGIGSGKWCAGQVLVINDMIGMNDKWAPKFVKKFANISENIKSAVEMYRDDVENRLFPEKEHSFSMSKGQLDLLLPKLEEWKIKNGLNSNTKNKSKEIGGLNDNIQKEDIKVVIVGAGAIGTWFAANLSKTVSELILVEKNPETIKTIKTKGIFVGNERVPLDNIKIVSSLKDLLGESDTTRTIDLAILATKSYDTEVALETSGLELLLKHDGEILTLQNGIGNRETIEKYFKKSNGFEKLKITQGVTNIGVTLIHPGSVVKKGCGKTIISTSTNIAELFKKSKIDVLETEDIDTEVWKKLCVNAVINPLTGIFGAKNGQLLKCTKGKNLVTKLCTETWEVVSSKVKEFKTSTELENYVKKIIESTADNKSSMMCDLENGRKTEIDFLNGAIVEEGKKLGLQTPINSSIIALVKAIQS